MTTFPSSVTYSRESICDCGFPALSVNVPVVRVYQVVRPLLGEVTWTCGGCGKVQKLWAIYVEHDKEKPGWMPVDVFDVEIGIGAKLT